MNLYQWLTILGVPSLLAGLLAFIRVQLAENKAVKLGIQALLRDRLLQSFKFYEARGWANYDEKSNVSNLFTQYEKLGENGVMQDMFENFKQLPTSAPQQKPSP